MITTVARNRAAAGWKEMMEKDFDIDYIQGINQPSPEMRTATAQEYAAYQLGQINRKLDKIIAALGSIAIGSAPPDEARAALDSLGAHKGLFSRHIDPGQNEGVASGS